MKKTIIKIAACALFAAALIATPEVSRAQGAVTNKPAAVKPLMFHGTVSTIDTNAMTFTVETRTFAITSETRITKNGVPATLSEGVIGEPVSGSYTTGDDGNLKATTVRFGGKAASKKKETAAGN